MGVTVAARSAAERPGRGAPVVEIAGPAGAGKTTLLEALSRAHPHIRAVVRLWTARYLASFAVTAMASTPLPVRQYGRYRWGWREMMIMIHLGTLHHLVPRSADARVTVFDQGPVFMLTRLYGAGVERMGDERVRRWWKEMIAQWASTVDTVVRLDAPDTVLMPRIRGRDKWHVTKAMSEQEAYEFLGRSRSACDAILARLGCVHRPRLIEFDTSTLSIGEIADILSAGFSRAWRLPADPSAPE
jgi:hypothetical protein